MSFTALSGWIGWLIVAAAVAAAIALFLVKLRPPQILVPSLTLWRRVLDDTRALTLWERIRRAVSLVVTAMIAFALALSALGLQPSSRTGTGAGRIAIVVDSSWSMLARTSSGGTRWDRAIARARAIASESGADEIVLATTAEGVVEGPTPDAALIDAALDRLSPSGGGEAPWTAGQGARATYFVTDGAVARVLDPDVIVESVFEPAANVAITAFGVRPEGVSSSGSRAFIETANYAAAAQDVRIRIARGSEVLLDTTVSLPPGAADERAVPLTPAGDARLRASVSAKDNALVVDDEAVAWIPGAQAVPLTLVSATPGPLAAALSRDPRFIVTTVSPEAYKPGTEQVLVFDRVVPATAPSKPALFIAPSAASWLGTPGTRERDPRWSGQNGGLLAGVDLATFDLTSALPLVGPDLVPMAQSSTGTPLIEVAESASRRAVVFTFDLQQSKLMFAPGFPVLMANTLGWLSQPAGDEARRPGATFLPARLDAVLDPAGKTVPLAHVNERSFASLARTGFYEVRAGGASSAIAVNAGDPVISDLRRSTLSSSGRSDAGQAPSRGRPWWLFAAVIAFVLVTLEWITWHRRITV